MHNRIASLTIQLPEKDDIKATCEAIRNGKKHIKYNTYITPEEVNQLIKALDALKSNSIETLNLESAFPSRKENRYDDLVNIFMASINKIKILKLGKNSLPNEFICYVAEYFKKLDKIMITVDITSADFIETRESKKISSIKSMPGKRA